jgi:hypothetical protein
MDKNEDRIKKPQILKQEKSNQANIEKTSVTMKKMEQPRTLKIREMKELNFKQIVQKQTTENYHHLLNNSNIIKLMREYSNLYSDNLEKKYNKILKEIIREKVAVIENEINSMRDIFNNAKESKINVDEFVNKESAQTTKKNDKINKGEFKDTFDLSKHSIKDIKLKVETLPKSTTESIIFNTEYANFYLNIDIDKSFEIYKDNISNKSISNKKDSSSLEEFANNFINRIYELDRLIYVRIV